MPEEKTEVVPVVVEPVTVPAEPVIDPLAAKDEEIAKLTEERDNYKTVALKRLGKLPGDADFMEEGNTTGLTVEEQVKKALVEREIARAEQEKEAIAKQALKENAELRLALKNRPQTGLGSDSGGSQEVKDNVFSIAQLEAMKQRATRLKIDPQVYIENAKKNLARK